MPNGWRRQSAVDTYIDATPDAVYDLVADVTRTGERSTECVACTWLPGHEPAGVGARFRGDNRRSALVRWSRVCEVLAADRGQEFTFRTVPSRWNYGQRDSSIWGYRMEPEGQGTRLTHFHEILVMPAPGMAAIYGRMFPHHKDPRATMARTVDTLRRQLHASAATTATTSNRGSPMQASQPIDVGNMAIIHRMFRSVYQEAARLVRAAPTPSPGRVTFLADHIDFGIAALHHHHEAEDAVLYPTLIERVPEQAETLMQVDEEHLLIQSALEAASAACAAWRERPSAEAGETLAAALDHLDSVAQPHLDDEEQKIVPLAAVTLTQREWDAMSTYVAKGMPRDKRIIEFALMVESLDEADRAYMMRHYVPAPVRMLYPLLIGRPWKKYAATLRTGA
jgi:hemerythrin-like domain-containing protein